MGVYTVHLVGESKYQPACRGQSVGNPVRLEHEPDNRFDPRAVRVSDLEGRTLGYLERDHWLGRALIDENTDIFADIRVIMGGTKGKPAVGIVLNAYTGADATPAREAARQQLWKKKGCLG